MRLGYIVVNRYYTDSGTEYAVRRLIEEGQKCGIRLEVVKSGMVEYGDEKSFDFNNLDASKKMPILFWDKDTGYALELERFGHKIINRPRAIDICNDKIVTYQSLRGSKIKIPQTIVTPLVYDVCDGEDKEFIDLVESELKFPIVVKENVGSQGRQVYLASNRQELEKLNKKLRHIPHHYQKFCGDNRNSGGDIRIYVVSGKVVASVRRTNTADFRGNVNIGGAVTQLCESSAKAYNAVAVKVSKKLKLDYCAIDFADTGGEPILLEVNSNAYFESAEKACGANIAGAILRLC
ncbi:MAG: RimK family alpha-L-glutamate ligase [Firmicutes bacterium]|nr:RimK family alpha-L-glutamate ligase [Bacillota bacterium]